MLFADERQAARRAFGAQVYIEQLLELLLHEAVCKAAREAAPVALVIQRRR